MVKMIKVSFTCIVFRYSAINGIKLAIASDLYIHIHFNYIYTYIYIYVYIYIYFGFLTKTTKLSHCNVFHRLIVSFQRFR